MSSTRPIIDVVKDFKIGEPNIVSHPALPLTAGEVGSIIFQTWESVKGTKPIIEVIPDNMTVTELKNKVLEMETGEQDPKVQKIIVLDEMSQDNNSVQLYKTAFQNAKKTIVVFVFTDYRNFKWFINLSKKHGKTHH